MINEIMRKSVLRPNINMFIFYFMLMAAANLLETKYSRLEKRLKPARCLVTSK